MKLEEALSILQDGCGKPFGTLFPDHPPDLQTNKGVVGQMLERLLGLKLSNNLIDFEDGELKTNKVHASGRPKESMAITQITTTIGTIITPDPVPFEHSTVYKKTRNFVYLPVVREPRNDPSQWYFVRCTHIYAAPGTEYFEIFKEDYDSICAQLYKRMSASPTSLLKTTTGVHEYLQIRTKDSVPYHPVYSKYYGRQVYNKEFAFYLRAKFFRDVIANVF